MCRQEGYGKHEFQQRHSETTSAGFPVYLPRPDEVLAARKGVQDLVFNENAVFPFCSLQRMSYAIDGFVSPATRIFSSDLCRESSRSPKIPTNNSLAKPLVERYPTHTRVDLHDFND